MPAIPQTQTHLTNSHLTSSRLWWISFTLAAVILLLACEALSAAEPVEHSGEYFPAERSHWSYQPVVSPAVPQFEVAADRDWARNPVDAFLLRQLREKGLSPAPVADRRTLIRRVTYDLTGLPPTPEEIDAFLAEPDAEVAWNALVDRLLASPQYGVRWGQHWLDVVRFAESEGFEYDNPIKGAWRFRDYVIHAFNSNKPYDQFLKEQLAGDEMAGVGEAYTGPQSFSSPQFEQLVASGFHRLGTVRRNAGNPEISFSRNEVLTEQTNIIGASMLGVTLGCARCHDHMFDAIRQVDYYRMQAFLSTTAPSDIPTGDLEAYLAWKDKSEKINTRIDELRDLIAKRPDNVQELRAEMRTLRRSLPEAPPALLAVKEDPAKAVPIHRLERGDENRRAEKLGMRVLGVLLPEGSPELDPSLPHPKTQLANWVINRNNPLTPRVMVNRLWTGHFGRGLVETQNDFGVNGGLPSHPELMDWLAHEFLESGWDIKHMHRLLLSTRAYRQSSWSQLEEAAAAIDPANRLLWKFSQRRLSAEEVRDSLLAVSGRLNLDMGGPGIMVPVDPDLVNLLYKPEQWEVSKDRAQHDRRSIFLTAKRNLRVPFLEVFDQPDGLSSCGRRQETTHAPQALEMLNGAFANEMAAAFAERLQRECGDNASRIVNRAFALVAGREPNPAERQLTLDFLKANPLPEFSLAMLNLNSFLYVE